MMAAHAFAFLTIMYSHDSMNFYQNYSEQAALGRWLIKYVYPIRGALSAPWLIGIICTALMIPTIWIILDLLGLESKLQILSVSAILTTNVTFICLFATYIDYADLQILSLALACMSVYAEEKLPGHFNILVSCVLLCLSMGIYQVYICAAAGLYILVLIRKLSDDSGITARACMKSILKDLFCLAAGTAAYLGIMLTAAHTSGTALSVEYNGPGRLKGLTAGSIFSSIPAAYTYIWDTFFKETGYNGIHMIIANSIMLVFFICLVILYLRRSRKRPANAVLMLVLLILLPLSLNIISLVSMGTMHQLMIYAFQFLYLVPFILAAEKDAPHKPAGRYRKIIGTASCIMLLLVSFHNIVYANGAYTYKKLIYDNTVMNMQEIWKDVNSIDGYTEGVTEVAFMGSVSASKIAYDGPIRSRYSFGLTGTGVTAITYDDTLGELYQHVLGKNMNISYNDPEISESSDYADMPVYPSDGYCRIINGKVVVKLSR